MRECIRLADHVGAIALITLSVPRPIAFIIPLPDCVTLFRISRRCRLFIKVSINLVCLSIPI